MFRIVLLTPLLQPSIILNAAVGQRRSNSSSIVRQAFPGCLLFIMGVSFYDCYLVAINRECILFDERNPICEMLIRRDPNHLSWFMTGKFLGNLCVVVTLLLLQWTGYRHAFLVTLGVAIFQMTLLIFLTFSDPKTGLLHFDDLLSSDPVRATRALNSAILHAAGLAVALGLMAFSAIKWKSIRNPRCSEPATA